MIIEPDKNTERANELLDALERLFVDANSLPDMERVRLKRSIEQDIPDEGRRKTLLGLYHAATGDRQRAFSFLEAGVCLASSPSDYELAIESLIVNATRMADGDGLEDILNRYKQTIESRAAGLFPHVILAYLALGEIEQAAVFAERFSPAVSMGPAQQKALELLRAVLSVVPKELRDSYRSVKRHIMAEIHRRGVLMNGQHVSVGSGPLNEIILTRSTEVSDIFSTVAFQDSFIDTVDPALFEHVCFLIMPISEHMKALHERAA